MKDLIDKINSTFLKRTEDLSLQKEIWKDLAEQFRPDLGQYRTARPTTLIARETGDLGLAVLWIVQTALIRTILKDISLHGEFTETSAGIIGSIDSSSLCALANSESSDRPVILTEDGTTVKLSGEKKFITAGGNAELIMVTCRLNGEEKVSRIALVQQESLPQGALRDLDLSIFRSVSHSSLVLENFTAVKDIIPLMEPSVVRRGLKKWGIIERALIMESFISYMIYVNRLFTSRDIIITGDEELIDCLNSQTASVNSQIEEAVYGERIVTKNAPADVLFSILGRFKEMFSARAERFSEEERIKIGDLSLFDNLKG